MERRLKNSIACRHPIPARIENLRVSHNPMIVSRIEDYRAPHICTIYNRMRIFLFDNYHVWEFNRKNAHILNSILFLQNL